MKFDSLPESSGVQLARAEITAPQTGIASGITDVTGLSITYTVTDRPVELEAYFPMCQQVTAAGLVVLYITTDTNLDIGRAVFNSPVGYFGGISVKSEISTPGTYTHKVRASTTAGTLSIIAAPGTTGTYRPFLRARTL